MDPLDGSEMEWAWRRNAVSAGSLLEAVMRGWNRLVVRGARRVMEDGG
jgi:hypothetical protein